MSGLVELAGENRFMKLSRNIRESHELGQSLPESENSRLSAGPTQADAPLLSGNTHESESNGEYSASPKHNPICGREQIERLFVYGTLMPGCPLHPQIARFVRSAHRATVEGILVDLGSFPALLEGSGIVRGVLLHLDSEAMMITDRIEGFRRAPSSSLYLREIVNVVRDDGAETSAWTYFYATPDSIAHRPQLIVGCDCGIPVYEWLRH